MLSSALWTGVGTYFGAQCAEWGMFVRVDGDTIMMSPQFIMKPENFQQVDTSSFAF